MATIHEIQRKLIIINKIKSTPYITLQDIISYVDKEIGIRYSAIAGVSKRTIQRDLKDIREELKINILYSYSRRGYYFEENYTSSDTERFLESIDILTALNLETGIRDVVLPEQHQPLGTKHLYSLIKAIKNGVQVSFLYHKFGEQKPTLRTLEPYAIKEFRGRWYLIGREPKIDDIRTFGLDRLSNLSITDKRIKKDKERNIKERFKYSYGIYSSEEYPIEKVILSFDACDGSYLKSRPIHSSQKILEDTKDQFTIELCLRISPDFIMEIISRSWSLQVISPLSLREKVCQIHKEALERNRSIVD